MLIKLVAALIFTCLVASCQPVGELGKGVISHGSAMSQETAMASEGPIDTANGEQESNDAADAVDIPQNVAGSFLRTQLSSENGNYLLTVVLIDPNTNQALRVAGSDRINWRWDTNLGAGTAQVVEQSTLLVNYVSPDITTFEAILKMMIRATWVSEDGRSFSVETSVFNGQQSPQYNKQLFSIVSNNTSMTIDLRYNLLDGQYLVTRTTDQELPFYPTKGQNYMNAVGTNGILYQGTGTRVSANNLLNGSRHKIQVWHQTQDFSYQLLGEWKAYTGSTTNENFTAADFSGYSINAAEFRSTRFSTVNFSNSDLTNANFRRTVLTSVSFAGAILRNANFSDASLNDVSFEKANLSGAFWVDGRQCKEGSIGTCL